MNIRLRDLILHILSCTSVDDKTHAKECRVLIKKKAMRMMCRVDVSNR